MYKKEAADLTELRDHVTAFDGIRLRQGVSDGIESRQAKWRAEITLTLAGLVWRAVITSTHVDGPSDHVKLTCSSFLGSILDFLGQYFKEI